MVEKMGRVGGLAEKAKGVLEGGKGEDLGKLFGENFRLRFVEGEMEGNVL